MRFHRLVLAFLLTAAPVPLLAQAEGMDLNRDGRITRAEFVASRDARFSRFDRNSDGVLRRDDVPPMARLLGFEGLFDRALAGADRNGDQAISRAELALAPTPAFDRADADRNGFLDGDEIARLRAELAARR